MPREKQFVLLQQAFQHPYVAPEIRKWMHKNEITPQEITSLVRAHSGFIEDDRDQCPLIDFDHWAEVSERLRQQDVMLPCDVEIAHHQPSITRTPHIYQVEDDDGLIESAHEDVSFLGHAQKSLPMAWPSLATTSFLDGRGIFSGRR